MSRFRQIIWILMTGFLLAAVGAKGEMGTALAANQPPSAPVLTLAGQGMEGTLVVLESDDFKNDTGKTHYYFQQDNGRIDEILKPENLNPGLAGARVRLETNTQKTNGAMQALSAGTQDSPSITVVRPPQTAADATLGAKMVAVLLVNFQSNPNNKPWTKQQIYNLYFDTSPTALSVTNYFKEISFEKTWIEGEVYDNNGIWFTLPDSVKGGGCGNELIDAAIRAADGAVDFSRYNRVVVAFPASDECSYSGRATYGESRVIVTNDGPGTQMVGLNWINGTFVEKNLLVTGHEQGHNYKNGGFYSTHANVLKCPEGVTDSVLCYSVEYGNPYDIMGRHATGHMSAVYKTGLNWFAPERNLEVVNNGIYKLAPLEISPDQIQSQQTYQSLKINRADGSAYFVEYRKKIGFDGPLSGLDAPGVFINRHSSSNFSQNLIYTDPSSGKFLLSLNKTYYDPTTGIAITPKAENCPATPSGCRLDVLVEIDWPAISFPRSGEWYSNESPLSIKGTSGTGGYVLEYAHESSPSQWVVIASQATPVNNGVLGTWDVRTLEKTGKYFLRLRANSAGTEKVALVPSVRIEKLLLKPGFPAESTTTKTRNGLGVVDINLDGYPDAMYAGGEYVGTRFLNYKGELIKRTAGSNGFFYWPSAVGELDKANHHTQEIVETFYDGSNSWLRASNKAVADPGAVDPLWSLNMGETFVVSPVLADLDHDGLDEVIVGSRNKDLYVFDSKGKVFWQYPVAIGSDNSVAVGDLDGDGYQEIVVGHTVYSGGKGYANIAIFNRDNYLYGKTTPLRDIPTTQNGYTPVLADLNGDQKLEILVGGAQSSPNSRLVVFDDQNYLGTKDQPLWMSAAGIGTEPVVGDIDKSVPGLEVAFGEFMGHRIYVLNNLGELLWSRELAPGGYDSHIVLGDINSDGQLEIVTISGQFIYVLNNAGETLWSFQALAAINGSPALGDLDQNGRMDIMALTARGIFAFEWPEPYDPGNVDVPWPMYRHDARRSGTLLGPPAPENLQMVSNTTQSIKISWGNTPNEDGFWVERSNVGPDGQASGWRTIATLRANTTSFNDGGLANSTLYWYRVRGFNSAGISDYSNELLARTKSTAADLVISKLGSWAGADTGSADVGKPQIFQFQVVNQGGASGGYMRTRLFVNGRYEAPEEFFPNSLGPDQSTPAPGMDCVSSDEAFCWTPTAPGTYKIQIKTDAGINETTVNCVSGNGGSVVEHDETNNCTKEYVLTVKPAPADFVITKIGDWANSSQGYGKVGGAKIFQYQVKNQGSTSAGYMRTKLYVNGTYVAPEEFYSSSLPPGQSTPAPGTNCVSSDQAFCWTPTALGTYKIQLKTDAGNNEMTINCANENSGSVVESIESNNCTPVYTYEVIPPPPAPSHLIATAVSSSEIKLTWTNNSAGASFIIIERRRGTASWAAAKVFYGQDIVEWTDTGLESNTTYYYRVYTGNAGGNSGYSNEASATTGGSTGVAFNADGKSGLAINFVPAGHVPRREIAG